MRTAEEIAAARKFRSEQTKAQQHARVEQGLCRFCTNTARPDRTTCSDCSTRREVRRKNLSDNRKTVGLCSKCSNPRLDGYVLCRECFEKQGRQEKKSAPKRAEKRLQRREQGLCAYCDEPAETGRAFCGKHAEYFRKNEYKASRRAYKAGEGRFTRARSNAVQRFGPEGWSDDLTKDIYDRIVARPCKYCGCSNEGTHGGLDRVDPDEPVYRKGNVVSCCYGCNVARNRLVSFLAMKRIVGPALRKAKLFDAEVTAWKENKEFDAKMLEIEALVPPDSRTPEEKEASFRSRQAAFGGGWSNYLWL